ncbi:MAG: hypothetical protein IJW36_01075 [Clostridia bacterium]|nr:hypothetical protein [Clostridia bacterium]
MINILFGGNEKVFDGILLCLLSMTKHTKSRLNVYILSADISELNPNYIPFTEKQISKLNQVVKNTNPNSNVNLVILGKDFNNWILNSKNKLNSYTPFAFLRLFADTINELPEKIIYLDTDIMINGNIQDLYDIDISNYELGVVRDRYGHFFIKPNYFNSGMLLMNMKKIKESNLLEKVKHTCTNKKMAFPDQSALNKCCKHKLYLPRKFNEQGKLRKDTIVHHFSKKIKWLPYFHTINIKPWQIKDVQTKYNCNNYDDIYDEYLKIKSDL